MAKYNVYELGWPDGKPVSSVQLADGETCHTLADGRTLTVSVPRYCLDYESNWPGKAYDVNIGIVGLSVVDEFFEAWNFDIQEVRHYRFSKTVRLTDLQTGRVYSGQDLRVFLLDLPF